MKLGELKAAIRDLEGAPQIQFTLFGGPWVLALQKGPLLAQLDAHFEVRSSETNLHLHDGFLCRMDRCDQVLGEG